MRIAHVYKWYIAMTKVLNIRSVPERLMRDIKTESFKKGMTLRDFVLDVLAKRVGLDNLTLNPKAATERLRDRQDGVSNPTVRVRRAVERPATNTEENPIENLTAKSENQVMPHEASDSKPKHSLNCHCYMCRPPKDK